MRGHNDVAYTLRKLERRVRQLEAAVFPDNARTMRTDRQNAETHPANGESRGEPSRP